MDPMDAYARYERAWNEPAAAAALLDEAWADDGVYADDEVPGGLIGRSALVALISETHQAMPGFRVWRTTEPRLLAGRLAVTWSAEGGAPPSTQGGTDVIDSMPTGGSLASPTSLTRTDVSLVAMTEHGVVIFGEGPTMLILARSSINAE